MPAARKRIRVVVVEDSAVEQEFLRAILDADPEIAVVATANDGHQALEVVGQACPDVVTMDLTMPRLNGIEATRQIMETHPVPIVIVSDSWRAAAVANTFPAIEAGAVTGIGKPAGVGHPGHRQTAAALVETVKAMASVKVVKRWPRRHPLPADGTAMGHLGAECLTRRHPVQVVAIGSSTGGPPVLQAILSALPRDYAAPVLIVQHMAAGFVGGLVDWLRHSAGLAVDIASHGEPLCPGRAYLAPDGCHMGVEPGGRIGLSRSEPEHRLRPAVSFLFRTVAQVYGARAIGVLLTGMGRDGAPELKLLRDTGGVTIAQDAASSVVHGMPGEAIRLGGAMYALPPVRIAAALRSLVRP